MVRSETTLTSGVRRGTGLLHSGGDTGTGRGLFSRTRLVHDNTVVTGTSGFVGRVCSGPRSLFSCLSEGALIFTSRFATVRRQKGSVSFVDGRALVRNFRSKALYENFSHFTLAFGRYARFLRDRKAVILRGFIRKDVPVGLSRVVDFSAGRLST